MLPVLDRSWGKFMVNTKFQNPSWQTYWLACQNSYGPVFIIKYSDHRNIQWILSIVHALYISKWTTSDNLSPKSDNVNTKSDDLSQKSNKSNKSDHYCAFCELLQVKNRWFGTTGLLSWSKKRWTCFLHSYNIICFFLSSHYIKKRPVRNCWLTLPPHNFRFWTTAMAPVAIFIPLSWKIDKGSQEKP